MFNNSFFFNKRSSIKDVLGKSYFLDTPSPPSLSNIVRLAEPPPPLSQTSVGGAGLQYDLPKRKKIVSGRPVDGPPSKAVHICTHTPPLPLRPDVFGGWPQMISQSLFKNNDCAIKQLRCHSFSPFPVYHSPLTKKCFIFTFIKLLTIAESVYINLKSI